MENRLIIMIIYRLSLICKGENRKKLKEFYCFVISIMINDGFFVIYVLKFLIRVWKNLNEIFGIYLSIIDKILDYFLSNKII